MEVPLQEVSDQIVDFIKSSPAQTTLGVHLGVFLKHHFPAFSPFHYGCRNLRQFIRVNVPSVRELGSAGLDIRYGIAEAISPAATTATPSAPVPKTQAASPFVPLPVDFVVWKAYSNPAYHFSVALNRNTGSVITLPSGTSTQAPWTMIPKPSTDVHHKIATEFVSSLSPESQPIFQRVLSDARWYVQFSPLAKKHGIGSHWAAFRRTKLIELFNASLRDNGVSFSPPLPRSAGHFPSASTREHISVPARASYQASATLQRLDDAAFRELIEKVVAELPVSELRLLKLPVGLVLDAVKR